MTTALLVLAILVLGILWSAWLWSTIRSGGSGAGLPPRHGNSDWGSPDLPTQPYSRIPRLP